MCERGLFLSEFRKTGPHLLGNEVSMALPTEPRIVLETGTVQSGTAFSHRTFFTYVTPTGAEMGLGVCPVIKREYVQTFGNFGAPGFRSTAAYILRGESRLKMVCLSSSMGKPRLHVNMFIDIGPDYEVIEFSGIGSCGSFSGRGRIDRGQSYIMKNKERISITGDILKEEFNYRVLVGAPASTKTKKTRSLIF